jgi:general secretion pathway protein G
MRRRPREQTIFFPWERGGGFFRRRGSRVGPIAAAAGMITLLLVLGARERRQVGIRSTRATISLVASAVDAYRADHERKCPATLEGLKVDNYLAVDPLDAWGRQIRLVCPGRRDPQGYELMSDGPDREMGGLDRVE